MISDFDIVEEKYVSLPEVKEILEPIEEKTIEQKKALRHAKAFSKLKKEKAMELKKELEGLEMRKLKEHHVAKIIDILPKDMEDLKLILEDSVTSFTAEELQKIFEVVSKYI